jgi:hypothetical protein
MSTNDAHRETDESSVEAAWRSIFRQHGIDEQQADLFVTLTFGSPELTMGMQRDPYEEIPEVVSESLADINFEQHLDSDSDPVAVRDELMAALDRGLEGDLAGPASAPRDIARAGLPPRGSENELHMTTEPPGGGPDAAGAPGPTPPGGEATPQAHAGLGAERASQKHERLADEIETLMTDVGLDIADFRVALDILERRHADDPTDQE